MLTLFKDYLRLGLFALGLLCGVQVPAFVNQYEQRVEAHLLEAQQNLSGFQRTADLYFSGSIERLIVHYRESSDRVFRQDAASIEQIYKRVQLLKSEAQKMMQNSFFKALHVATDSEPQLLDETVSSYQYTVPLNPLALLWGIACALLLALASDSVLGGCRYCVRKMTGAQPQH